MSSCRQQPAPGLLVNVARTGDRQQRAARRLDRCSSRPGLRLSQLWSQQRRSRADGATVSAGMAERRGVPPPGRESPCLAQGRPRRPPGQHGPHRSGRSGVPLPHRLGRLRWPVPSTYSPARRPPARPATARRRRAGPRRILTPTAASGRVRSCAPSSRGNSRLHTTGAAWPISAAVESADGIEARASRVQQASIVQAYW